jgi:hypothetical protein
MFPEHRHCSLIPLQSLAAFSNKAIRALRRTAHPHITPASACPSAEIIEHLSQLFTLHPGDVITTGTPPGVGLGIKPNPVFQKKGNVMDITIQGFGRQRQTVSQDA